MPSRDKLDSKIVRLYRAGSSLPKVAAALGLHVPLVRSRLVAQRVPIRPRGMPPGRAWARKLTVTERAQIIADLREARYPTLRACAAAYGISRASVRLYALKAGLQHYTRVSRSARARARTAAATRARTKESATRAAARLFVYRQVHTLYARGLTFQQIADFLFLPSIDPVRAARAYFRYSSPDAVAWRRTRRRPQR